MPFFILRMEIFVLSLGFLGILFILYLIFVNTHIKTNKITISSSKIPDSFDNYKIVFLSDLHDCSLGTKSRKRLLRAVEKSFPDVIFLGGDMHEKENRDKAYFSLLDSLGRIAPIYFVEGNHEIKLRKRRDFKKYSSEFEKRVFNLNGRTSLVKGGKSINLYGCGYFEYEKNLFDFDKKVFSIFLCHSPFVFDDLLSFPDLMLSGHVHGGIIELPFIGAVFAPGDGRSLFKRFRKEFFFPKYYKNSYEKEGSTLVVGRGLGNFKYCPIRLISPEIVEITLNSKNFLQ